MNIPTIGSRYRIRKEKINTFSLSKSFWEENYSFQGLIDGVTLINFEEAKCIKNHFYFYFNKGKNVKQLWLLESFFYWFEEYNVFVQEELEL